MLAKDVIKAARQILSDVSPARWTDERLLALLNDGLMDISRTTILFTETLFVQLINGQVEYDLSPWALKILRMEYEDKALPVTSHEELDSRVAAWQLNKGPKAKAYILDKQKEAHFKIYPVLENSNMSNMDFGGFYGIITGISYSELEINVANTFGDLGPVAEDGFVKVFYIRKHPKVTELTDELYVSNIVEEPLSHYIAGRALRDNQDTQNRAFGAEELNLYKAQLTEYAIEKSRNFSQAKFSSRYNPTGA